MSIISAHMYPAIRAAIDVSIDDVALPDVVIRLPIYQGVAESDVLVRDPLALTRDAGGLNADPVAWQHVQNAVVFFTAAYLVSAIPRLSQEDYGQRYTYKRQLSDPADIASSLRGRGNDELDAILQPKSFTAERPTFFTTVRPSCVETLVPTSLPDNIECLL